MTAKEALSAVPNWNHFDVATLERLLDVAFPDRRDCTGQDLTCQCSWHCHRRDRDPGDPYGLHAASRAERRREIDAELARLRRLLPTILRDAPELLPEQIDLIETYEERRDELDRQTAASECTA